MTKKLLFGFAMLALMAVVFGMTEPVYAAGEGWQTDLGTAADSYLPYYKDNIETIVLADSGLEIPSCDAGVISFGAQQAFLKETDPTGDYARVRVVDTGDELPEGSWAIRISNLDGDMQYGCAVNDAEGIIDIVVPITDAGFLVTLANVNDANIEDLELDAWVATSKYEGGGLIIDSADDCGDEDDRDYQASTLEGATWSEVFKSSTGADIDSLQFFLDIPAGTYNMGVQDTTGPNHPNEPFVAYYHEEVVSVLGYWDVDPCKDATKVVTVSADCAPYIDGADVFLNITGNDQELVPEGAFLAEDLTPGKLVEGPDYFGELVFAITPFTYWDVAVVKDDDPINYYLIAEAFNAVDKEITFDLCNDPVVIVQPNLDMDWDSGQLTLVPPVGKYGNLDERDYDIETDEPGIDDDYVGEYFFLLIDKGCCGPGGEIVAKDVVLDNYERLTPCCEEGCDMGDYWDNVMLPAWCQYGNCLPLFGDDVAFPFWHDCAGPGCYDDMVIGDETTAEIYAEFLASEYCGILPSDLDLDGDLPDCFPALDEAKWYYTFQPKDNPWAVPGEGDPWDEPIADDVDKTPIFGDGPYHMVADPLAIEYVTPASVSVPRGDWFDAYGNQITKVLAPDETEVTPAYLVQENVSGKIIASDASWDTTALGPVSDIGRYMYEWWLGHGYLGDIVGHESQYFNTCCFDYEPCDPCEECEEGLQVVCEFPHYADGGRQWFAISPVDVRMNSEWGWSWVMALYELDLTTGYTATTYEPDMDVSRAEVAAFLGRLMKAQGLPMLGTATQFVDVPPTHWAAQDILMLRDYGIVIGREDDRFYPFDPVTRAEMTKMIQQTFRTLKNYGAWDAWWDVSWNITPSGEIFADVPEGMWYTKYVEESYADGLVDGRYTLDEDKYFVPEGMVTRQEMAKFLVRAIQVDADTQGFWPTLAAEK